MLASNDAEEKGNQAAQERELAELRETYESVIGRPAPSGPFAEERMREALIAHERIAAAIASKETPTADQMEQALITLTAHRGSWDDLPYGFYVRDYRYFLDEIDSQIEIHFLSTCPEMRDAMSYHPELVSPERGREIRLLQLSTRLFYLKQQYTTDIGEARSPAEVYDDMFSHPSSLLNRLLSLAMPETQDDWALNTELYCAILMTAPDFAALEELVSICESEDILAGQGVANLTGRFRDAYIRATLEDEELVDEHLRREVHPVAIRTHVVTGIADWMRSESSDWGPVFENVSELEMRALRAQGRWPRRIGDYEGLIGSYEVCERFEGFLSGDPVGTLTPEMWRLLADDEDVDAASDDPLVDQQSATE